MSAVLARFWLRLVVLNRDCTMISTVKPEKLMSSISVETKLIYKCQMISIHNTNQLWQYSSWFDRLNTDKRQSCSFMICQNELSTCLVWTLLNDAILFDGMNLILIENISINCQIFSFFKENNEMSSNSSVDNAWVMAVRCNVSIQRGHRGKVTGSPVKWILMRSYRIKANFERY